MRVLQPEQYGGNVQVSLEDNEAYYIEDNDAYCWECAVCSTACKMDMEEMDAMDAKRMHDQNAN